MASVAPSNSFRKTRLSFGSSYDVLHLVMDDFFMQNLIVYCEPDAKLRDTSLRQGGDVVSVLIESVSCRVSAYI